MAITIPNNITNKDIKTIDIRSLCINFFIKSMDTPTWTLPNSLSLNEIELVKFKTCSPDFEK